MGYSEDHIKTLIEQSVSPWLVKSSGRILGPFSKEEIEEKVRTRELVPLDEVSRPLRTWKYLRDEPLFAQLVESVKEGASDDNEPTMTATLDAHSEWSGGPHREAAEWDAVTPTPTSTEPSLDRPREERGEAVEAAVDAVESYGYAGDKNIERELQRTSRWGWLITLVVLALVVFTVFTQREKNPKKTVVSDLQARVAAGAEAYQIGDFKGAATHWRKVLAIDPRQVKVALQLAPLVIQLERDLVFGRQILQDISKSQSDKEDLRQAFVGLALADLIDKQMESAEEFLVQALEIDATYIPTLVNTMSHRFLSGKYRDVIRLAQKVKSLGGDSGEAVVLNTLAHIELALKQPESRQERGREALKEIDEFIAQSTDYVQELMVLKDFLETVLLKRSRATQVPLIVNEDPYLSGQHWHEPAIYRDFLAWDQLVDLCQKSYQASEKNARDEGLLGLCHLRSGQNMEAGRIIENAVQRDPNDPLLLALKSFHLMESGDVSQGLGLLNHLIVNQPSTLSLTLMGYHCRQPSVTECREKQWGELLRRDPDSVSALAGLALSRLERGDIRGARPLIERGLRLAPRLKPFRVGQLELQKREKRGP